jgi:hypothetical protein
MLDAVSVRRRKIRSGRSGAFDRVGPRNSRPLLPRANRGGGVTRGRSPAPMERLVLAELARRDLVPAI